MTFFQKYLANIVSNLSPMMWVLPLDKFSMPERKAGLTPAAKAAVRNRAVIAALKCCATQNQEQHSKGSGAV